VVVVDKNAEEHCVADVAEAFVEYLHGDDAQELFQTVGYFRPIDPAEAAKANSDLNQPALQDIFTTDDIGGWDQLINTSVFGPTGVFTQALQAAKG
jgi:sulfate transport system substrate-binding protein